MWEAIWTLITAPLPLFLIGLVLTSFVVLAYEAWTKGL